MMDDAPLRREQGPTRGQRPTLWTYLAGLGHGSACPCCGARMNGHVVAKLTVLSCLHCGCEVAEVKAGEASCDEGITDGVADVAGGAAQLSVTQTVGRILDPAA